MIRLFGCVIVVLLSGPGINPNLRPEEFTALKEAQMKKRGAEIITVDAYQEGDEQQQQQQQQPSAAAAAATDDDDGMYTPKVATWGIFPRPKNISKAYGGGRNIRPGQALETDEQKKAREVGLGRGNGVCCRGIDGLQRVS
jgi:hypothetical protein